MSLHLGGDELAEVAASGIVPPRHVGECEVCTIGLREYLGLASRLRAIRNPPRELRGAATAYFRRRRARDALIVELAENPALRARAARDPAGVLRDAGLDPTPELTDALRDVGRDDEGAARRLAARLLI